ncbi:MAG TPA: 2-phosphosulfolactate phosphatase [Bacilli bacterium]
MQIDVVGTVNEARSDDFYHKTVIVIDVLRATSTIATALEHGCAGIIPVETVSQAVKLQTGEYMLGGERFCKKLAGFDLGNSPLEYTREELAGKQVILTTTNGTRALQKSQKAENILAGSLLNASACAKAAVELKRDIVILCAGTLDMFSIEDGLCAGFIVDEIGRLVNEQIALNDLGIAMRLACAQAKEAMEQILLESAHGKKLTKLGYRDDVVFCSRINVFSLVPILKNQLLVPYTSSKSDLRS